jgi:hypothetical protein
MASSKAPTHLIVFHEIEKSLHLAYGNNYGQSQTARPNK